MFKVGDTVRRVRGSGGTTEPFVIGRLGHRSMQPGAWRKGGSDYDFHYLVNLELVRTSTPAERKQEQLDLIAEKERVIGECNEAIEAARKLIAEIDNRPPSVGDKYREEYCERTVVAIDDQYIYYRWVDRGTGGFGATATHKTHPMWGNHNRV